MAAGQEGEHPGSQKQLHAPRQPETEPAGSTPASNRMARLAAPQGYGLTLGTITTLSVLTSVLQAIPSLPIQVLTIITWMVARFFMYSRCAHAAASLTVPGGRQVDG
jgi:hypothetical protein